MQKQGQQREDTGSHAAVGNPPLLQVRDGESELTNSNGEDQLKRLRLERDEQRKKLRNLAKGHDRVWKQEILILAQILERELLMMNQSDLIEYISEQIAVMLREDDIKIWTHVSEYLPAKYKHNTSIQTGSSSSSSPFSSSSLPPPPSSSSSSSVASHTWPANTEHLLENSSIVVDSLRTISHTVFELPKAQIAEIENLGKAISQQCKKRAEIEHIALLPSNQSSVIDQTNEGKQDSQEHLSTDKPKPHGSLTHDACKRASKIWSDIADRVFEFPNEILLQDKEIAASIDMGHSLLDSALDLKYSQDWSEWFITEKYRDQYGKHAAGVMSYSVTNLCGNCSDEKTKEWVRMEPVDELNYATYQCLQCQFQLDTVCPRCNISMKLTERPGVSWKCTECGSTRPITRDLTREQVGDKSSIVTEKAVAVLEHIPQLVGFFRWYRNWIKPRVAGRKERLSDELSEKA